MIAVKRTACPPDLDPADPNAAGPKELRTVTDKRARGEALKSRDFSAYGRLAVRDALRTMFHGKCAYCESKIAGTQDTDIEHYRPKKGVSEANQAGVAHEGYWWLAMVWENLVLSCQHCNQSRSRQVIIPDDVDTLEQLEAFLKNPSHTRTGKLNSFPTEDSRWVTSIGDNHRSEKPLLINPVDVDPADHLEWVLREGASLIRAKDGSPVGKASIRILGLNRRWLEEERRIELMEMLDDRNAIIEGINGWLEADHDDVALLHRRNADRGIERLLNRTALHRPFAGMASAFLRKVQAEVRAMQV